MSLSSGGKPMHWSDVDALVNHPDTPRWLAGFALAVFCGWLIWSLLYFN